MDDGTIVKNVIGKMLSGDLLLVTWRDFVELNKIKFISQKQNVKCEALEHSHDKMLLHKEFVDLIERQIQAACESCDIDVIYFEVIIR